MKKKIIIMVLVLRPFFRSCFQAEWIIPDSRPPDGWPQNGNITFQDFDLRYREGLPLVLKNINCVITPGEKVNFLKGSPKPSCILDRDISCALYS